MKTKGDSGTQEMGRNLSNFNFNELKKPWPSAIVARTETSRFTGGLLSPRYCANLDSRGEGPPAIRIGRKIAYPVDQFVEWLRSRAEGDTR